MDMKWLYWVNLRVLVGLKVYGLPIKWKYTNDLLLILVIIFSPPKDGKKYIKVPRKPDWLAPLGKFFPLQEKMPLLAN